VEEEQVRELEFDSDMYIPPVETLIEIVACTFTSNLCDVEYDTLFGLAPLYSFETHTYFVGGYSFFSWLDFRSGYRSTPSLPATVE
jgi:hypothetical protein